MDELPESVASALGSPKGDVVFAGIDAAVSAGLAPVLCRRLSWHASSVPGQQGYRRGPVLDVLHTEHATEALHRLLLTAPPSAGVRRVRSRVTRLHARGLDIAAQLADFTALEDLELIGGTLRPAALSGQPVRRIHLDGVSLPEGLDGLGQASRLRTVHLQRCAVRSLAGLSASGSLQLLAVVDCPSVIDLSPLFSLRTLRALRLVGFAGTRTGVLPSSLRRVELEEAPSLSNLAGWEGLQQLRWARLCGAPLNELEPLAGCRELEHLELERLETTVLDPIGQLGNLHTLRLVELPLRDLSGLEHGSLEVLELRDLPGLQRWHGLPDSRRWARVEATRVGFSDLTLPDCRLPVLRVRDSPALRSTAGLHRVHGLRQLDLRGASQLLDPSGLVDTDAARISLYESGLARRQVPAEVRGRCSWARGG